MSFLLKFKGKPNEYILTGTEKPIEPRAILTNHTNNSPNRVLKFIRTYDLCQISIITLDTVKDLVL